MADFRRHHWRPKLDNYSFKDKTINPRISMIVAVSSKGDIYLTLTQSNSNKSMMGIFLERLVSKLDNQNPRWRFNHILTWDGECSFIYTFILRVLIFWCSVSYLLLNLLGAPYHRAEGAEATLERLKIPIMMHGPYSYDVASAELFFAAFKSKDINPNRVPMGKSHFDNVV